MPFLSEAVGRRKWGPCQADQFALLVFYFRINACCVCVGGGLRNAPSPQALRSSARHRLVEVKVETDRTSSHSGQEFTVYKAHL